MKVENNELYAGCLTIHYLPIPGPKLLPEVEKGLSDKTS